MSKPVVAIVGRPNVGKSTLFNALAGDNISIVKDTPGVTRDRIYADVTWLDRTFTLIDTGGIEPDSSDIILSRMREQAQIAIDTADVIIFITDVRQGLVDSDAKVADMLRRSGKPVRLVVNKVDSHQKYMMDVYEFYNLGIGEPIPISAANRQGLGDMLDEVIKEFPDKSEEEDQDDIPKIAIVGKPNVGKSSLINKLLGEERVIVSNIAGTTRDAIDTKVTWNNKDYVFIDTAGLREATDEVERIGISRAWTEIEQADRIILMLDSSDPDSQHIEKVRSEFLSKLPNNMPVTIVRNKVDLSGETVGLKEENGTTTVCLSAQTHQGVDLLREHLKKAMGFQTGMEGGFLARRRHLDALEKAAEHLQIGLVQLTEFHAGELLAEELRLVQANLSEITGQFTSDDLLGNIFSSFCIGK